MLLKKLFVVVILLFLLCVPLTEIAFFHNNLPMKLKEIPLSFFASFDLTSHAFAPIISVTLKERKQMKKSLIAALLQFVVVFTLIGSAAYVLKGDFFYHFIAPIFGIVAGFVTLGSQSLIRYLRPEKKS